MSVKRGLKFVSICLEFTNKLLSLYRTPTIALNLLSKKTSSIVILPPSKLAFIVAENSEGFL